MMKTSVCKCDRNMLLLSNKVFIFDLFLWSVAHVRILLEIMQCFKLLGITTHVHTVFQKTKSNSNYSNSVFWTLHKFPDYGFYQSYCGTNGGIYTTDEAHSGRCWKKNQYQNAGKHGRKPSTNQHRTNLSKPGWLNDLLTQ